MIIFTKSTIYIKKNVHFEQSKSCSLVLSFKHLILQNSVCFKIILSVCSFEGQVEIVLEYIVFLTT